MPKTEEQNTKKRRKLKFKFKVILMIIFIVLYAFFIGTKGIFVKEYKITNKNITNNMHGLKILQFSDVHFLSSVNKSDIKKIVKKINQTNPDIVIFTGDLVSKNKDISSSDKTFLTNELNKIKSEYGKYYVTGEEDFEDEVTILNTAGFINLENANQDIYITNKEFISLVSTKNAKEYYENNEDLKFNILVMHDPDDIDKYKKYKIDVSIAGHTHNGQINIPYVKDLLINSKYKKTYQKINNIKLFINPGIGTSKFHARLFNHPTMYLYRLNKTSK